MLPAGMFMFDLTKIKSSYPAETLLFLDNAFSRAKPPAKGPSWSYDIRPR